MKPQDDEHRWANIDRPTMPEPQEEFLEEKARPSIDISQLRCARCGKPGSRWGGRGVKAGERWYCSPACAAG